MGVFTRILPDRISVYYAYSSHYNAYLNIDRQLEKLQKAVKALYINGFSYFLTIRKTKVFRIVVYCYVIAICYNNISQKDRTKYNSSDK